MSIGNNTPETAHAGSGEQKRLWKRKKTVGHGGNDNGR